MMTASTTLPAWRLALQDRRVRIVDVARAIGVVPRTIVRWRDGRTVPRRIELIALCAVLGISADDAFCEVEITVKK